MASQATAPASCYEKLSDAVRLIESFESCTLAPSAWDHTAHLTVAVWYLAHYDEPQAAERAIEGLLRFNRAHDIRSTATGGYHETLTLFWLGLARRYLDRADPGASMLDRINGFIALYGDHPKLYREYYSKGRIRSWRARHFWVDPDLRPLD